MSAPARTASRLSRASSSCAAMSSGCWGVRPAGLRDELDRWLASQADRLPRMPQGSERLAAFRGLRDTLHEALSAAATGDPLPAHATHALNAASGRSDGHVRLRVRNGVTKA